MKQQKLDIIKKIQIKDFNYDLPDDRIAKYPLLERDSSKILFYQKGVISDESFINISNHIPKNSLLVVNNTKVVQARIIFYKSTGARIEIFCLEPHEPVDFIINFQQKNHCKWKCIIGNNKKWKNDLLKKQFIFHDNEISVVACKTEDLQSCQIIEFSWDCEELTFSDILEKIGETPIPPYLNRQSEDIDKERYQTVFSIKEGSVAAPTAGLHFTDKIFESLRKKGIAKEEITLHVGAGTFKPVKSEYIFDHEMHTEHFFISVESLKNILANLNRIIAVGTTSLRTLESLYWVGVNIISNKENLHVSQWRPYQSNEEISVENSLNAILKYMKVKKIKILVGSTNLMIVPGYEFKLVKGIITNFHQPKSTLLLLISAFIGADWKNIYEFAMKNNYRFLSYGDSSLLLNE